jgi:hypothetical protein
MKSSEVNIGVSRKEGQSPLLFAQLNIAKEGKNAAFVLNIFTV